MPEPVYLDHAATTPPRPEVQAAMLRVLGERWGNPSSVHRWGRDARATLDDARARLAAVIGASPAEIVFTRGGTEADNLAVRGRARAEGARAVAVSAIEHKAVLATADALAAEGVPVRAIVVDGDGLVEVDALTEIARSDRPAVVSVMWANNETGAIQPVERIAALCADAGVAFHTDAVQALGKVPVRMDAIPATLAAFSAHKLGGPRGTGALFVRRGTKLYPLLHGGGQERGLRSGTEDVAGAVGLALAAELAESEREAEMARLATLRDRLQTGLCARVPGLRVNAAGAPRLPTILNVSAPGADAEMLLMALDREGVAVSSGSACSSGAVEPSHVLTAMGLPAEVAGPSVRFSLARETTAEDIDRVLEVFPSVVERVRF
ncbi:cysteine desulfurase family protein [Longimicrobium sp.]|uniref:cysteine desulfurase family protein n=1 Tax=Longimicrobium sp. TaxID=2029185 RepID=UPI002E32333A|nr:cysteine desulfurase family protein [Longimicrobium sp.]HEX6037220.1 cysteine desulfurase family protein [Longimicrobium sp.]